MKKNYLNIDVCKECGGKCCKLLPGIAHPRDFNKPLAKSLLKAFESGHWGIDWYEGDPRQHKDELRKTFFVRPRIKGVKKLFDPAWSGECIFLAYDGCTLKPLERPRGCRLLEPISIKKCIPHVPDKEASTRPWIPYQKLILKVARVLRESPHNASRPDAPNFLEALLNI